MSKGTPEPAPAAEGTFDPSWVWGFRLTPEGLPADDPLPPEGWWPADDGGVLARAAIDPNAVWGFDPALLGRAGCL